MQLDVGGGQLCSSHMHEVAQVVFVLHTYVWLSKLINMVSGYAVVLC